MREIALGRDDYEDVDDQTDQSLGVKSVVGGLLAIAPDYFAHVLDDPPDNEIPTIVENLRCLGE